MSIKRSELERLCREGLITREQCDSVSRFEEERSLTARKWLGVCLWLMAVLMVVSGIGFLVGAHFEELPRPVIVGITAALMSGAWAVWLKQAQVRPVVAQGAAALGAALWACLIILIVNLYHSTFGWTDVAAIIFAGLVPLPFVSQQVLTVGAVAGFSGVLWLGICTGQPGVDGHLVLGLEWGDTPVFFGFMFLLLLWWVGLERYRERAGYAGRYWLWSIPCFLIFLYIVQGTTIYHALPVVPFDVWCCVWIAATVVMLLLLCPRRTPKAIRCVLSVCTGLMPAVVCMDELHGTFGRLCGVLICAVYALVLLFCGVKAGRAAWVNYGVFLVLCCVLGALVRLVHTMQDSGLLLVGLGVVFVLLVRPAERCRRALTAAAEKNSVPAAAPSEQQQSNVQEQQV